MWIKKYITRTTTYTSLVSSCMILFLFLSRLKETGWISFDIGKYFIPIFIGGFVLLLIVGWIDVNFLKALQSEATIGFNLTPPMVEMKKKIDYLYEKENGA